MVENNKCVTKEIDMASHEAQPLGQAEVYNVGARGENLPNWAKEMLERQTILLEKLLGKDSERPWRNECYLCGKTVHFKRDFPQRFNQINQGNGNRAGSSLK